MTFADYTNTTEYQNIEQPTITNQMLRIVKADGTVVGTLSTNAAGELIIGDTANVSGFKIDAGGPTIYGDSVEISSLAHGDFRQVGVDPFGELFGIEPDRTWCQSDQSIETWQIENSYKSLNLSVAAPQVIDAGDPITIDVSVELFNYDSAKRNIDIGYSINGGTIELMNSFEINPNFNGSKALNHNYPAGQTYAAGTTFEVFIKVQEGASNVWTRGDINGHALQVCSDSAKTNNQANGGITKLVAISDTQAIEFKDGLAIAIKEF